MNETRPEHPERAEVPFAVRVFTDDSSVVAAVSGEVDLCTASELEARLREAVETEAGSGDGSKPEIVVDLAEVTFLGARGLAVLVAGARLAAAEGKRLVLRHPSPLVGKLVEVTNLEGVFPLREKWSDCA